MVSEDIALGNEGWHPPIDRTWTVLVDRDGVINRRIACDYVRSTDEFVPLPDALDALAILSRAVSRVLVVTNQAGIGKSLMTVADLDAIHAYLRAAVARRGGRISAVLACPHLATDGCPCRKPSVGLATQALNMFPDIRPSRILVMGDSPTDIEFANRIGAPSILIGDGRLGLDDGSSGASARADSLSDAVRRVLSGEAYPAAGEPAQRG